MSCWRNWGPCPYPCLRQSRLVFSILFVDRKGLCSDRVVVCGTKARRAFVLNRDFLTTCCSFFSVALIKYYNKKQPTGGFFFKFTIPAYSLLLWENQGSRNLKQLATPQPRSEERETSACVLVLFRVLRSAPFHRYYTVHDLLPREWRCLQWWILLH